MANHQSAKKKNSAASLKWQNRTLLSLLLISTIHYLLSPPNELALQEFGQRAKKN